MTERIEGLLERTLVLGITGTEVLFSHVVTQFAIMFLQSIMLIIFAFVIFALTLRGDIIIVFLLIVLTGICGMSFGKFPESKHFWIILTCFSGFVVSCVVDSERNATYLSLGSFLPIILLCGMIKLKPAGLWLDNVLAFRYCLADWGNAFLVKIRKHVLALDKKHRISAVSSSEGLVNQACSCLLRIFINHGLDSYFHECQHNGFEIQKRIVSEKINWVVIHTCSLVETIVKPFPTFCQLCIVYIPMSSYPLSNQLLLMFEAGNWSGFNKQVLYHCWVNSKIACHGKHHGWVFNQFSTNKKKQKKTIA